jgi:membrane protein CcdC involved in cytochrome C biogenesis
MMKNKGMAILLVGILVIITGFYLLSRGPVDNPLSLSVAPMVLILGYCVIIPVALVLWKKTVVGVQTTGKNSAS